MTRTPSPHRDVQLDRIWFLAFPAYWAAMFGYGLFAILAPIVSVTVTLGEQRGMLIGAAIAVTAMVAFVGAVLSIVRDEDRLDWVACGLFLLVMVVYFALVYQSTFIDRGPPTRAGSAFVPVVFSIFPFVRFLAIGRRHRAEHARGETA